MGRSGGGCGLSSMTQILHGLGVRWTKEFKALRSQLWWGGQGMMVGEEGAAVEEGPPSVGFSDALLLVICPLVIFSCAFPISSIYVFHPMLLVTYIGKNTAKLVISLHAHDA
ncbi:unnamed protein product [Prunus armeniaca]|uniref:Uncharacterized protein n=1 Tax=Prunus armeniaca TaxID=36596 RepID=A0A6J5VM39_PRUAR|nr:unnamed protein product [Prunus armeniaca]CAB4319550.1 unnamed protein product [Prunus armeniaca]